MDQDSNKKPKFIKNYQKANHTSQKLQAQNLSSLKYVLQELQKIKKTPSTSLHTTASKRNQQSQYKDNIEVQTPQTSYRSRLSLTKRNEWIDLINQKSQQNLQSDQISITEYRTKIQMDCFFQNDWKQPYYKQEKIKQINQKINQYQPNDDINSWKQLVDKRLHQRIS
ncbi:unnamed protein product [Paramecium sonneborni]|uniref:Uncharacterized protein n=1 Tax=Paramecium sonneborni TaxID=65129 RepID=A0A8S1MSS4_9CILI|nr:unnamed protein product [Paramecium sonneborni]